MLQDKDISLRLRLASYLDRTSLGIYLELLQAALSILSCCLYIAETYYVKIPEWMNILDILLCVIFLSDFILHVFLAEKKYMYIFSRYGLIDLLTVLPVLIGIGATGLNTYRHMFFFLRPARVLRAVRILRFLPAATKATAARRQMIFLIYSGVCLVFIFSGLFQYVENNSVLGSHTTRDGVEHKFLPFHESVYFNVILAYTVSFGDPVPTNWVGKFVAMSYIIVTALVIPLQIRKLIKILAMQKDGGWVAKSKRRPHFIVTGSVNPTNFANFLSDFFDTRQKHDRARIVVLSGSEATDDFDMIHLPYIENKIHWLLGSVLVPIDLKRSQSASASGAFIFANSTAAEPNKEDKLNILRALSLRKHNPAMPVSVQLIDSSWKVHVEENSIIPFALDEVKMNLLVWSTLYPGFSTLISNMLMWRLQIPLPVNPPDWLKEYAAGLNQTLVEIEIPHKYLSETFTAVVVDVYNQYGITVVGIRKSGAKKVILAPLNIDLRMSVGDSFVLLADVNQLQQFADKRFLKDLLTPHKRSSLHGIPLLGKLARRNSEFLDSLRLDVEIDSQEADEESMAVGEDRDMFFHEHFEGSAPKKPRRRFPFMKKSKTVAVISDMPRSASRPFMLMDLAQLAPPKFPTATEKLPTRTLAECTITKLDPMISQHIVLCGCPRSRFGLYHFMQPLLLPVKIGEAQEPPLVVILSQDPPAPATWAEVAHMSNILYISGNGMKSEDLFAAGIERARSIVILSSSAISSPSVVARSKHGVSTIVEAADMIYSHDADVILTTRAIHSTLHSMKSDSVFTISEMVHTKTFNLLALHEGDDTEFFLSPGFASGYFYDAGITERLIYQCHEKQFLKDIFNKIFSTKHKKRSTFISQISVPEIEPMTYGNLFSWAVRRNMIPVGLYRPMNDDMVRGSDNFVTVNPPANTILSEKDRVFVWCSVLGTNKN